MADRTHMGVLLKVNDSTYPPSRAYRDHRDEPTGGVDVDLGGGARVCIYGPAHALRALAAALNQAADQADALPVRAAA